MSPQSYRSGTVALHPPVATFVEAVNTFDLEWLLATFADDALVNDQLREYSGATAIRQWAVRDVIGERLTMAVTNVVERHCNLSVTANVDGNFDKRGLPDPLVVSFYFSTCNDLIVQLIILRKLGDI
ncbi:nuclear transport factor 2 family protein [Bradyrhizobium sp. RDT46]|uniref:nuclear transport factor 2 family protein n=1 Tax=Bradyrhizobium sp. RDT46 TaxID=3341829 RepID=UPI0035C751FD